MLKLVWVLKIRRFFIKLKIKIIFMMKGMDELAVRRLEHADLFFKKKRQAYMLISVY